MQIREGIVVHGLLEVDGIEHLDAVAVSFQQLAGFQQYRTLRVGHDVGAVHLHEIGLDEKARLTGTGAADHQHVFIAGILGVLRTVRHHQPLGLGQDDILARVRIHEWCNILARTP